MIAIKQKIQTVVNQVQAELIEIRRDLHRHPELASEEYRTAKIVSTYLRDLGLEVEQGIATTGVVAHLKGDNPIDASKVIALRADMDALPIQEETTHLFQSTVQGKMHACGHDAHTASLLGVAKILSSLKSEFAGTVKFIFQPSEEKIPGGAKPMLDAGIFQNPKPQAVFGQHCIPQLPVGKIGFYAGAMMAASDELYFTIRGVGGHGSAPHRAKDPIVAAMQLVTALQTIVSRNMPPAEAVVVSICAIHGGSATNIIPNEVKMMGTLRTMNETLREQAWQRLRDITYHTAKAMGVEAELEIRQGYPVLINDKTMTEFAAQCSEEYLGAENTLVPEPIMGAEDFAYFLQSTAGSFWQLGVGNPSKGIIHNIHSSQFDIDEEALRIGAGFTSYLTLKFLSETSH
jgi:amidohydrolase